MMLILDSHCKKCRRKASRMFENTISKTTRTQALMAGAFAAALSAKASVCYNHSDQSLSGYSDPCSYTEWYLYAHTWTVWGGIGAPGGIVSIGNGCTGSYTNCQGNNIFNGQYYTGSKYVVIWDSPENPGYVEFYWNVTHKGVYMDQCTTPGWYNPVPTSWSGIYGWVRIWCN